MDWGGFTAPRVPRIAFGAGGFERVGGEVAALGRRVIVHAYDAGNLRLPSGRDLPRFPR